MLVFPVSTSDDVYGNVTEMYERFVPSRFYRVICDSAWRYRYLYVSICIRVSIYRLVER